MKAAYDLLEKSRRALEAAESLLAAGHTDFADYQTEVEISEEVVVGLIAESRRFLERARLYLDQATQSPGD